MTLRFLSICSGIEGASLAFEPLGWTAVGFAEIKPFPCALLAERYGSNLPGEPLSRNGPPFPQKNFNQGACAKPIIVRITRSR